MAIPSKYLNEGEHVLVSTRTHAKALFGPLLVLVILVAAVVAISLVAPSGDAGTGVGVVTGVVAAVVAVWWVLRPFISWYMTTYTFTNRRFLTRTGFIATEGRSIPLNRVSGVDFEIGLIDRIFGCGTLVVTDASVGGNERVHDIPRVEQVHLLVAEELHRISGGFDAATGGAPFSGSDRRDDGA